MTTLKKLTLRLLGTTCLTAAATVAAHAGTVTEPGGGFGNTFATATLLPVGTTEVDGTATLNHGSNAYFELQGLTAGASLSSLSFLFKDNSGGLSIGVTLLSDTNTTVTAFNSVAANGSYSPTGTVPNDGFLVVDISPTNEGGAPYVLTLSQASTPEPGTFAALGLGLTGLGAAALRRRKK